MKWDTDSPTTYFNSPEALTALPYEQHDCICRCWLWHYNASSSQSAIVLGVANHPTPLTPGGIDYYTDYIFILPEELPWYCNEGILVERVSDTEGRVRITSDNRWSQNTNIFWDYGKISGWSGSPARNSVVTLTSDDNNVMPDVGDRFIFLNLENHTYTDPGYPNLRQEICISNPIYAIDEDDVMFGLMGLWVSGIRASDGMMTLEGGFQCPQNYYYNAAAYVNPNTVIGAYRYVVGKHATICARDGDLELKFQEDVTLQVGDNLDVYWQASRQKDYHRMGVNIATATDASTFTITGGTGDALPCGKVLCVSDKLLTWEIIDWWGPVDGRNDLREDLGPVTVVWDNPDEPTGWKHISGSRSNLLLSEIGNSKYPSIEKLRTAIADGKGFGSPEFPMMRYTDYPAVTVGFIWKRWIHHWAQHDYHHKTITPPAGSGLQPFKLLDNIVIKSGEFHVVTPYEEMINESEGAYYITRPTRYCDSITPISYATVDTGCGAALNWCAQFQYIATMNAWRYYWPGPRRELYGQGEWESNVAPSGPFVAQFAFRVVNTLSNRGNIGKKIQFNYGIPIDPAATEEGAACYGDEYTVDYNFESGFDERPAGTINDPWKSLDQECAGYYYRYTKWPCHDYQADPVAINGNPSAHCLTQTVELSVWREPGDDHIQNEATCNTKYKYTPRSVPDPLKHGGRYFPIGMKYDFPVYVDHVTLTHARGAFQDQPGMCGNPGSYCFWCWRGQLPMYLDIAWGAGKNIITGEYDPLTGGVWRAALVSPKTVNNCVWEAVGLDKWGRAANDSWNSGAYVHMIHAQVNNEMSEMLGNITATNGNTWSIRLYPRSANKYSTQVDKSLMVWCGYSPTYPSGFRALRSGDKIDVYYGFWRVNANVVDCTETSLVIDGGIIDGPLPTTTIFDHEDLSRLAYADLTGITHSDISGMTYGEATATYPAYELTVIVPTGDLDNSTLTNQDGTQSVIRVGSTLDVFYGMWLENCTVTGREDTWFYDVEDGVTVRYQTTLTIHTGQIPGRSLTTNLNGEPVTVNGANPKPVTLYRRVVTASNCAGCDKKVLLPMMVWIRRNNYSFNLDLSRFDSGGTPYSIGSWRTFYDNSKPRCKSLQTVLDGRNYEGSLDPDNDFSETEVTVTGSDSEGHEETNAVLHFYDVNGWCKECPNCSMMASQGNTNPMDLYTVYGSYGSALSYASGHCTFSNMTINPPDGSSFIITPEWFCENRTTDITGWPYTLLTGAAWNAPCYYRNPDDYYDRRLICNGSWRSETGIYGDPWSAAITCGPVCPSGYIPNLPSQERGHSNWGWRWDNGECIYSDWGLDY